MRLTDIYSMPATVVTGFLWEMLRDRDPAANISHQKMPTPEQHKAFVDSKPYEAWYAIEKNRSYIGTVYLSRQNEIGVFLMHGVQGRGIGSWAVQEIMRIYGPRRYLANIAPTNVKSQDFFRKLGFKLIQYTFERET
jgi:RimJ/RimL family protein N-acetyltransferase